MYAVTKIDDRGLYLEAILSTLNEIRELFEKVFSIMMGGVWQHWGEELDTDIDRCMSHHISDILCYI